MSLKLSPLVREWLKKAYVPATGELFWFAFEPDRIRSIVKPVWFYHGSGDIDFVCSQGHQFGMSLIEIRQKFGDLDVSGEYHRIRCPQCAALSALLRASG
jgi:hypothetical protein